MFIGSESGTSIIRIIIIYKNFYAYLSQLLPIIIHFQRIT